MTAGAYLANFVCAHGTGDGHGSLVSEALGGLIREAGIRSTDVHDIVFAEDRSTGAGTAVEVLGNLAWPVSPTVSTVDRAGAGGLQAIAHAMYAAASGQQDVVIAAASSVGACEQAAVSRPSADADRVCRRGLALDAVRAQAAVTATVVVSEYFARRSSGTPSLRLRRFTSASGYAAGAGAALAEAALRLTLNENLNLDEVDLWYVAADSAVVHEFRDRLCLEKERVDPYGPVSGFGGRSGEASARAVALAAAALEADRLRYAAVLAQGPAETGCALLIERVADAGL